MPQQVHVIDAVRPGDHPGHQAADLQVRVHSALAINPDMLCDQHIQARALGQGHHRDQARLRHEIRVIKRRVDLCQPVQQSHLRGVLSSPTTVASATPIVPVQRAPFASARPANTSARSAARCPRLRRSTGRDGSGCRPSAGRLRGVAFRRDPVPRRRFYSLVFAVHRRESRGAPIRSAWLGWMTFTGQGSRGVGSTRFIRVAGGRWRAVRARPAASSRLPRSVACRPGSTPARPPVCCPALKAGPAGWS
jgi:hypothetical protein